MSLCCYACEAMHHQLGGHYHYRRKIFFCFSFSTAENYAKGKYYMHKTGKEDIAKEDTSNDHVNKHVYYLLMRDKTGK